MSDRTAARRFWLANTAVWVVYAAISVGMGRVFAGGVSSGIVLLSIALGVFLCLGSGLLRSVAVRRRWLELDIPSVSLRLLGAIAVTAAGVQAAVAVVFAPSVEFGWVEMPVSSGYGVAQVAAYWINTVIVLGLWTGAWVGWRSLRRARASELAALRAESDRRALELDALRARLNPHFVFNALNNLRALINEDPERAREVVTRLSGTLRHALEHSQREWTTMRTELQVVDDYLAVEKVHYEERLRWRTDITPPALEARLPPMALQLLVENAIKHGISRTPGGGEVAVEASMTGTGLVVRVTSPGRIDAPSEGTGVGLAYLRNRLQRTGGAFALRQRGDDVVATLEVRQ